MSTAIEIASNAVTAIITWITTPATTTLNLTITIHIITPTAIIIINS